MTRVIAGKAGYVALCLLAAVILVVAGYTHQVVSQLDATGKGITIPGSPSVGAMNILVMGLESRTDYQGNELDHHMQVVLHSGHRGGQDTNVLILIHIFAGRDPAGVRSAIRQRRAEQPERPGAAERPLRHQVRVLDLCVPDLGWSLP